jgi:hypothetical protein
MKRALFLPALLIIAACGTPQEQCISASTRDARVVSQLISETETNIARGYALETVVELNKEWVDCTPVPTEKKPNPKPKMCFVDVPTEVTRPVAIDLNAERAKLTSLRQKQADQARQATAIVVQCQALYPE